MLKQFYFRNQSSVNCVSFTSQNFKFQINKFEKATLNDNGNDDDEHDQDGDDDGDDISIKFEIIDKSSPGVSMRNDLHGAPYAGLDPPS